MHARRTACSRATRRWYRWGFVLLAVAACCSLSGCVRRRMTIVSNPPGALAYVDNQEIGVTPVSTPFTYYGSRDVRLERDGYETMKATQRFDAPWYQYPPIEFFVENLWPWEIRDERIVEVEMQPQRIVPTQELLDRANVLRGSSQQGVVIPTLAPEVVQGVEVQQYAPTAPRQVAPETLPGPIGY